MAMEIVDFPMKNGGSFHSYVNVYQRVINVNPWWFLLKGEIPSVLDHPGEKKTQFLLLSSEQKSPWSARCLNCENHWPDRKQQAVTEWTDAVLNSKMLMLLIMLHGLYTVTIQYIYIITYVFFPWHVRINLFFFVNRTMRVFLEIWSWHPNIPRDSYLFRENSKSMWSNHLQFFQKWVMLNPYYNCRFLIHIYSHHIIQYQDTASCMCLPHSIVSCEAI